MLEHFVIAVLKCAWFYLPAAAANMAPVLFTFVPWNRPIWEAGLGPNKTWRGLIAGILVASLIVWVQKELLAFDNLRAISIAPYSSTNVVWLGALFGAGALLGDATKSYFKRHRQIPSGEKWWPFDQIDFILGSTLFISLVFWPDLSLVAIALLSTLFLHPAINWLGYRLGLKQVPW